MSLDSVGLCLECVGLSLDSVGLCLECVGLCLDSVGLCLECVCLCLECVGLCLDSVGLCLDSVGLCLDSTSQRSPFLYSSLYPMLLYMYFRLNGNGKITVTNSLTKYIEGIKNNFADFWRNLRQPNSVQEQFHVYCNCSYLTNFKI